MGRADILGAFVKLGYNEGSIEIEVKGPRGQPNLVIQRYIASGDKKTQAFTLNGVKVKGSEITERVEALGIQVNNLCSFLPQDKVSQFASMSPQTLLKATEKAAGDENLSKWHEILITEGKTLKTLNAVGRNIFVMQMQFLDLYRKSARSVATWRLKNSVMRFLKKTCKHIWSVKRSSNRLTS